MPKSLKKSESPSTQKTTSEHETHSLSSLIRRRYADLSPAEKKLVAVLQEEEQQLGFYSATQLAAKAGISKSSAARCFRRLGFDDFNDFRRAILPVAVNGYSPLRNLPTEREQATGGIQQRLEKHLAQEKRNLDQLQTLKQEKYIEEVIKLLGEAPRIWLLGFRNGFTLACYALAALSNIHSRVALLNSQDGRLAENVAAMNKNDILLVMDFPRRMAVLNQVVHVAAEAGVEIIIMSHQPLSELAVEARVVLTCANTSETSFDSYVAAISMINFITSELTLHYPDNARSVLEKIENIHDIINDLD